MFKISVPITKTVKKGTKLIVEGYASDTTIDRDEERFSESAIKTMKDSIRSGGVKIRLEHENKFYTNIGEWVDGDVTKDNRLYVKGEIDTELSLGKDVEVLLKRGEKLELSVGGRVLDATTEYVAKLRKTIKVYTNVVLEEISILLNPSNFNTELNMAKTVDWAKLDTMEKSAKDNSVDHVPYTTEAQKAYNLYKSMEFLKPKVFETEWRAQNIDKKKFNTMKEFLEFVDTNTSGVLKDYYGEEPMDDCCEMDAPLTIADLQVIAKLTQIMTQVQLPTSEEEDAMYTDAYWESLSNLGEECYIMLSDRTLTMPHHNADYSVNKEWVLIRLKQLIDGQNYWKPKDFSIAINHLYKHLKELELIKSNKLSNKPDMTKTLSTPQPASDAPVLTREELDILKSAYDFAQGRQTEIPKLPTGEVMSKEYIEKYAFAYDKLSKSPNFNSLINQAMTKKVTKNEATPVDVADDKEKETPETPATEVVETPATEETTTPETPAVETTVEVKVDSPEVPVVETPAEKVEDKPEDKKEDEPEVEKEEEKEPEPVKVEEPKKEEPEKEKEEEPLEPKSAPKASNEAGFTKAQGVKLEKAIAGFQKSVDDLAKKVTDIEGSLSDVTEIQKTVGQMSVIVDTLSKVPLRKGIQSHVAMEKAMQGQMVGDKTVDFETLMDANLSKGMTWVLAYQKAKEALAAMSS